MSEPITGGCQCGRVRYRTEELGEAYLCHCKMCRRATGGASIAFVNVPVDKLVWESEPDWYQSSPIARRPFCSACGTPLGFAFLDSGRNVDVTVGSLDDPSGLKPVHNYATESILPNWLDASHLPGIRSDENANVVDRWMKTLGHLPD